MRCFQSPFTQLRSLFLITVVVSAACGGQQQTTQSPPAAPAAAPAAAQPADVIVRIAGGNAIVLTNAGTEAVVGPIAPQPGSKADYNDHDMDLLVADGDPDNGPTFAPADATFSGAPLWRAKGYDIRLCEDGNCATNSQMNPPVKTPPPTQCFDGNVTNGSLFYVPNLSDLHPGSAMVKNWRDRLATRLILQKGDLVTTNVVECFEFKNAKGQVVRRDSIANGVNGLENRFKTTAKFIDVEFSQGGKRVKTVRVTPHNHKIDLSLFPTGHPTAAAANILKPGQAVTRFNPFYELLDPATLPTGRLRLTYEPSKSAKPTFVNPGPECPMIAFNAP